MRTRLEAAFGPDALARAVPASSEPPPAWGKGPVAELMRRPRRRRARGRAALACPARRGHTPILARPAPRGHIPFTPRAKKSLALALREAVTMKDNYIGVQHIALALTMNDGMVPVILSALGASNTSLRAAILDRYRKAS